MISWEWTSSRGAVGGRKVDLRRDSGWPAAADLRPSAARWARPRDPGRGWLAPPCGRRSGRFHENHIVTESLAFNLLMGRGWPPSADDLEEAEILCRELGLGELLARKPSHLQPLVGETGWQLSPRGEEPRLPRPGTATRRGDLLILDESFAALDPGTLDITLQCALHRAKSLLVVAHA